MPGCRLTHSVPEAEHEDGGDEGGDEQARCHQQVDLPGYKNSKHHQVQKMKNTLPDELAPHRCKVKGVNKTTSGLHLVLTGLAVVEGAVRVPLLLLTTGPRKLVIAASSPIPHLKAFQCQGESTEKSCIFNCFHLHFFHGASLVLHLARGS